MASEAASWPAPILSAVSSAGSTMTPELLSFWDIQPLPPSPRYSVVMAGLGRKSASSSSTAWVSAIARARLRSALTGYKPGNLLLPLWQPNGGSHTRSKSSTMSRQHFPAGRMARTHAVKCIG